MATTTTTTAAVTSDPAAAPAPAPHVLLVPYPARGHMQPLLHLASRLSAAGLRLTVVATTSTLHLLSPLLAEHPSSVSPLTFPSFEHDTSGPTSVGVDLHALAALREPLGEWVRARARCSGGDGRVVAVLSDFFCGWTQPLAAEAGVPRLVFAPSGVLATAATHSLFRRMPRPPPPTADAAAAGREYAVEFPGLPGAPAFPWRHLSRMYRSYVEGHGGEHGEAIKNNFLWNLESSAFVCNTSRALEGRYLDAQPLEDLAGKRVWAVGPVAPEFTADESAAEVTRWLDAFPDASVAYVSFGSMMALPPPHAASLAAALEKSKTPFVWAASTATLPEGFEERATAASATGLVIRGWAPQTAVLRHRAVGCFVTHCGWNSVVEAAAAGVPMLAWPMAADQFFNARLVVDEARVAAPVSLGGFGHVPGADELTGVLREVVGEAGSELRARARELAARMAEAARGDGSSRRDLDGMVRELWDLGSRS
uniref:Glycosyltransferase n=1 Tax=Oryza meridionalis TaxID=40149 RepID=A0A0E0E0L7_9ORYZ